MRKIVLLFAGVSMLAIACNNSEDNRATSDTPATVAETAANGVPTAGAEEVGTNVLNQAIAEGGSAAPAAAGQAVNPPHGEPGHDCGIPVGAPLNSGAATAQAAPKPDVKVAPAQTNNPAAVQVAPAANSGVKVNPPHGEPGHDCAVAVGAPLNK